MTSCGEEFAEFYISCNPPLLPDGVDNVVKKAKLDLQQNVRELIIEMLYEPEVPWFKIISRSVFQDEITRCIQRILTSIADDIAPVDVDAEEEDKPRNERGKKVDVHITAERYPDMIPWISHEDSSILRPEMFDQRFPVKMENLRHRVLWRAYRFSNFTSLHDLLGRASRALADPGVEWTLDELGSHFQCAVAHNLHERATVVYIGSGYSVENVNRLLETLDKFAEPEVSLHGHIETFG